jgi:hypothetical protein
MTLLRLLDDNRGAVDRLLGWRPSSARRARPGVWKLVHPGGREVVVRAAVETYWLTLQAPIDRTSGSLRSPACARKLLEWNGRLFGGTRFVPRDDSQRVAVVADLPLLGADDPTLPERFHDAFAAIKQAVQLWQSRGRQKAGSGPAPHAAVSGQVGNDLAMDATPSPSAGNVRGGAPGSAETSGAEPASGERGSSAPFRNDPAAALHTPSLPEGLSPQASGWPFATRGDGTVAFTLEVPDAFSQALLVHGQRGWQLKSELFSGEMDDVAQRAVGQLLLQCGQQVQGVRPVAGTREVNGKARYLAGLVVDLGRGPSAALLEWGLSALSVAARQTVREVKALADASLAQAYLEIRGWSA